MADGWGDRKGEGKKGKKMRKEEGVRGEEEDKKRREGEREGERMRKEKGVGGEEEMERRW